MSDVFISYSRKDKDFVQRLSQALQRANREAWVDWEDIPLTADWWAEIQAGIEAANAFVFIISPESVTSEVCGQEVAHATQHNKRIVPIVYRDAPTETIPSELGHINWVFLRNQDDFESGFQALLEVMDTDLEWVKAHTQLTRRAVDWDRRERNDSYVLHGDELDEFEQLLAQTDKRPRLTDLQVQYILASRQKQEADRQRELALAQQLAAEAEAREQVEAQRAWEQAAANRRLRRRGLVIIVALLLIIVGGVVAGWWYVQTSRQSRNTRSFIDTLAASDDADANHRVCQIGVLSGLPVEVYSLCDRAVELDPNNSQYYIDRGLAHTLLERFQEAGDDFRQAAALARQNGEEVVPELEQWADRLDRHEGILPDRSRECLREIWREKFGVSLPLSESREGKVGCQIPEQE